MITKSYFEEHMKTHAKVGGLVALIAALAVSTAGCGKKASPPVESFVNDVNAVRLELKKQPYTLGKPTGNTFDYVVDGRRIIYQETDKSVIAMEERRDIPGGP
ncbi:MAG: hypothetical protein V1743_03730, partial [Nanoarchaeota archaeon]